MQHPIPRRQFLRQSGFGLSAAALAHLWGSSPLHAVTSHQDGGLRPGIPGFPNHNPRVKRVIFLCQSGGPSHLDTFDHKPKLTELDGKPMPPSFTEGQPIAQLQGKELRVLGPQFAFQKHGESGLEISEALPWTAKLVDKICVLRGMKTEQINHDPANTFMNTGVAISGRPSMGSWVTYGLGSESSSLPGFVVLSSVGGRDPQPINSRQWNNGFLPSRFQGVPFQSKGDPVHYVASPPGVSSQHQRDTIDAIAALNQERNRLLQDPEATARLAQYEMAFRMQSSIPELADFSKEPQEVLDLYGTEGADGSYAANCLMARRLAERGVRFIQLYHRGWDHHDGVKKFMKKCSDETDRATWALITDLERSGLLEDTLVVWGGEFGRTPMSQGSGEHAGRDHHIRGFSMWVAGGGIRPGMSHGATDDMGYLAVEDITPVHDLHATMLHLLGIDHKKLTVRAKGRDFRLTDVHGEVIQKILA